MFEGINTNVKKTLKKGFTTGTYSAAVSKAAVLMLLTQEIRQDILISLPVSGEILVKLLDLHVEGDSVTCAAVKYSGDDPDVTNGIKIFARAKMLTDAEVETETEMQINTDMRTDDALVPGKFSTNSVMKFFIDDVEVEIIAGIGIGRVTLPGLSVSVGQPAVNPVPRKMIENSVREAFKEAIHGRINRLEGLKKIVVEIYIPDGYEVAKKTYNARLGIEGGISILGTTGIVEPVSDDAWMEALEVELGVMKACGYMDIVFAFGNIGEDYAVKTLDIDKRRIIKTANFYGFCLESARRIGFEKILVVGHIGKLVKVSAGIFNTHSRVADARMETLAAYSALEGAGKNLVTDIYNSNTTQEALRIIEENGLTAVYDRIVQNSMKKSKQYVFDEIDIGIILIDHFDKSIGESWNVSEFLI